MQSLKINSLPVSVSLFSVFQDGFYLSLQRGVDWFAGMAGIPPERKYNSVLFGGRETEQTC